MSDYFLQGEPEHPLVILAHGAGADSHSDFLEQAAAHLVAHDLCVVRFNFPYMRQRLLDGKKRPPDRAPTLLLAWQEVVAHLNRPCVVAGKSMGGRMATLLAASASRPDWIKGCACLGYPFHPPGKPDVLRTEHLQQIDFPLLIAQGTRDALGRQEEITGYGLDDAIRWCWLEDGNHDFKPRKASGFTQQAHLEMACRELADFARQCLLP